LGFVFWILFLGYPRRIVSLLALAFDRWLLGFGQMG
jgi:hypothetical protein